MNAASASGSRMATSPSRRTAPSLRACWVASRRCAGIADAEVLPESCQGDGAPYCQWRMRWEEVDSDARQGSAGPVDGPVSQARLEELHHTVAELVSGDSLETVLTQVMAAAGRAVPALSYILAVTPSARVDRWLCTEGFDVRVRPRS